MEEIIGAFVISAISAIVGFIISKKIDNAKFDIYIEQAKAKAKVIELEAENLLNDAKLRAKKEFDNEFKESKKLIEKKEREINYHLEIELENIKKDKSTILESKTKIEALRKGLESQERDYSKKLEKIVKILENVSGLTEAEAKEHMIELVKDESRDITASIFRKVYKEAQKNSKKEVQNILSHAVTRYAGEFAAERLTNNISLKDEETKGKIIGKEGRNIKTLEMCLGVDIIIGDIPNTITVSSFNLYRRAIATKVIDELIEDGRIQPARIEEVYQRVKSEFDAGILREGENTI